MMPLLRSGGSVTLLGACSRPPRDAICYPIIAIFLPGRSEYTATGAPPVVGVMLVAAVVLLIAHTAPAATVTGLVFVPVLALLLALCQGVSLVRVTAARIRLPYAWVAGVLCGLVMVAGVPGRSPLTALVIACGACVGLRRLIAAEG